MASEDASPKPAPHPWLQGDLIQRLTLALSVVVGIAYVGGHLARHSYLTSLGLGSLSSTREALIGTGAGLLLHALPWAFTFWYWPFIFPTQKRKVSGIYYGITGYLAVSAFVASVFILFFARQDFESSFAGILSTAFTTLPVSLVFMLGGITPVAFSWVFPRERNEQRAFVGFTALLASVPMALLYGRLILPHSNSTFGGLVLEEVTVHYKDGPKNAKRLLIDADDKVAILGINLTRREFLSAIHQPRPDQTIERVAWDEIASIQRPFVK